MKRNVKKLAVIIMSPIVQLWKHYYRSSKHDARSKHVRRDEGFLSLARIDKLYHELKW